MKTEDVRHEAVEDEVVTESPNVPDDIYNDAPVGDDIPVLTLGDTGVDAPVLISNEDETVEISDTADADDSPEANETATDVPEVDETVTDVPEAGEIIEEVAEGDGNDSAVEVNTEEAVADADKTVASDDNAEEAADIGADDIEENIADTEDTAEDESPSLSDEAVTEAAPTKEKETVTEAKPHATEKKKRADKDKVGERKVDGLFDFIELFVFTLAIVLFVTSFFIRQSVVDGDSMLGTLHDKETLLISDFLYEPKRGDIVVVDDRSAYSVPIIKRVIAVGGDTVRITKIGVIVNGELLDEPYVYTDGGKYEYRVEYRDIADVIKGYDTLKYKDGEFYEFVVPEGKIFVMGDHRNASTDSRTIGPVDVDAVLGRVLYRILPFSVFGPVE